MLDLIKPKKLVIKGKAANALFPMIVGLSPDLYLRGMRAIAEGQQIKLDHSTPGSDIVPRVERLERAIEKHRLANITTLAAERVDASADPSMLNANWRERFVSHASKIADEDMHEAWSRILAGEVNAPGTFSIRAIATVADMQYHDAKKFAELCQYTWQFNRRGIDRRVLVEIPFGPPESPMDRGINYHALMDLEAFGLVSNEFYKTGARIGGTVVFTHVGDSGCTLTLNADDYYDIPLGGVSFTTIGRELSHIVDIAKPPPEYVEACFRFWARLSEHRGYRVVELTGGPSLSTLADTNSDIRLLYGSDFGGEKRDLLMNPALHAAAPSRDRSSSVRSATAPPKRSVSTTMRLRSWLAAIAALFGASILYDLPVRQPTPSSSRPRSRNGLNAMAAPSENDSARTCAMLCGGSLFSFVTAVECRPGRG